jgi:DNA repair protein RecO (recombination protein O)
MPRRLMLEAVVLRAIDVGEADRLCVLFTREQGRKAARARSVRKTGSRLGGTLLPFRHISVELSESEHHSTVTGATDRGDLPDASSSYAAFVRVQQGVEMLLALTEDDEPIPGAFDLLTQFIRLSVDESRESLLPFQIRLLHLLGFLPEDDGDLRYRMLSEESRAFVHACARIADLKQLGELTPESQDLRRFMRIVTDEQLQRPLKSSNM